MTIAAAPATVGSGEARYNTHGRLFGYKGGTFTEDEIAQARESSKPLTMDCALPGQCLNNCIYCGFAHVNTENKLSEQETLRVFEEFATLGGKSIKVLGEGEPLLSKNMLHLLKVIRELSMIPVLFTCGDVLGSEELAKDVHKKSCDEIADELFDCDVTVVLKYEKPDQDEVVQRKGYSILRDIALERMISRGFNKFYPSQLGFAIVLTNYNYQHVRSVFTFALDNNIYPLVCPLMPIGRMHSGSERNRLSPKPVEIAALSRELILLGEQRGVKYPGPSDFPGGLPCDISRAGMYMDDVGNMKVCESATTIGNVKEECVESLWQRCSKLKDAMYGEARWKGLCFPKRKAGII